MAPISKPFIFYAGEKAKANEVNENFDIVYAGVNELDRQVTDLNTNIIEVNEGKADVNGSAQQTFQVADGTSTYEAINKGQLNRMFPIGTIIAIHNETVTNDETWLVCDGSSYEIDDYGELYNVIGTIYGTVEGNRFRVPNMSNRTLWGKTSDGAYGYVNAGLPNITGSFSGGNDYQMSASGAFTFSANGTLAKGGTTNTGGTFNFNASRSSSIYGKSTTVQPPSIKVTFLIKHS